MPTSPTSTIPTITNDDLCGLVQGPDFPTGASIFRYETRRNPLTGEQETIDAIREMYAHGHGRVVMRAQVAFEESRADRMAIIVTELPYQVNKASLLEKIADLVKDKKIEGIGDLRDESDRDGMRIYIEVKRDANPHKVLNNLFKHTALQTDLQPQHAGPRRRPAADPAAQERAGALRRAPPRDRPPPHRVRPREGARPGPHPRGPQDRARQPRRGHQDHPRVGRRRARPQQPDGPLRAVRAAGPGDPRHAPRAPGRPRAQEDRGRVPRRHPAHRRARGHPRQPVARPGDHQGRAGGAEEEVRRRAPDPRRRRLQPRDDRRGPHRRRGRGRHDQPPRLHQAPAGGHLPPPAPRRQGDHRPRHPRGGRRRAPPRRQHPRLGAVLHQPRPRVLAKVHPIPDASRQAKGMAIINLPGVQVESGEVPVATIMPAGLRARPLPGHGHPAAA